MRCTKFRAFNALIVIGVINILVFRAYFQDSLNSLWTSRTYTVRDVNTTLPMSPSSIVRQTFVINNASGLHLAASITTSLHDKVANSTTNLQKATNSTTSLLKASSSASSLPKPSNSTTNVLKGSNSTTNVTKASSSAISLLKASSPASSLNKDNSIADRNATQALGYHGKGRVMQAWGKVVMPRADVTVPWSQADNSSTLCPLVPPDLVGPLATYSTAPNWTEIVKVNPGLEPGGHYKPKECRARHRVAIIVPYRDREEHLRVLLHNLLPILTRQQLDYFFLVVELAMPTTFNRGMLLNIGAVEALGLWDVQCFIFHDVDLVPENDKNLYTCPDMPRHMSAAVDKFGYKLPYTDIMGGVSALSREHLYKINGYSNLFFGWGGEDDDLSARVTGSGLKVTRYSMKVARYRMIKHAPDKKNEPNPRRFEMLKYVKKRQPTDGLNSLQYEVQKVEFRPAYTWILVTVDKDKLLKS